MITLPGLIDTHVHLREPGAQHKEDFETGTKAAIAGGYTLILDMPNNPEPTISPEALDKKITLTQRHPELDSGSINIDSRFRGNDRRGSRIYCDVGFHFGATSDSIQYFKRIKDKVFGLKVYMNHTTGTLLQEDPQTLQAIFLTWPKDKILMVHAEGETAKLAIQFAKENGNRLHVCHVSQANEISLIRKAKLDRMSITCEVTCHHLFLTEADQERLGPYGIMRPPLATKEDQQALWDGIADGTVDIIASDHAPHTKEEKNSPNPPNGVPGLETTLPLLLTAVNEGRLTIEKIIELTNTKPRRIFSIPPQFDTIVEVDPNKPYTINHKLLYTKCGWTPFEGMKVVGKIKRVVLKGQIVFNDGEVLQPAHGHVINP